MRPADLTALLTSFTYAVWNMMDGTETRGAEDGGTENVVDYERFNAVSDALDQIEALPDDGISVMGASALVEHHLTEAFKAERREADIETLTSLVSMMETYASDQHAMILRLKSKRERKDAFIRAEVYTGLAQEFAGYLAKVKPVANEETNHDGSGTNG